MKILVMADTPTERSLIQGALQKSQHEVFFTESVEHAQKLIKSIGLAIIIVDNQAGSRQVADLIHTMRAAASTSLYFLTIASANDDIPDSDDILSKPFTASELAARLTLAQRFLALGESLVQARNQIESTALYDSLTGVMNQAAFLHMAWGELERARRAAAPLSMVALHIDNLKSLNDVHGVPSGENILKVVAQTIREKSRPYDCIGRWTSDAFIVAFPGVIGDDAEKIAERMVKGIRSTQITAGDQNLNVSVSAGVASILRISSSTEIEPLIDQATQAMARAEESGGNQVYLSYM
jgi:diguanylate cyclase (GGDEF)-like protein